MRALYIRHAEKQYNNTNDVEYFKHDPGITEIGVERSKKIAQHLISEFGVPTRIVSSPFRRARETALIMNSVLEKPFEEIRIDTTLSEYLGNHMNTPLDVTVATKIHNPPHPEMFDEMKRRVKKHVETIKKFAHDNAKELVWFISHGIVINTIAEFYGIKTIK